MKIVITALLATLILTAPSHAGTTSCQSRKSGSVTITTCSGPGGFSQCRSYRGGSVNKTSCRS